jgi:hypothetical protein
MSGHDVLCMMRDVQDTPHGQYKIIAFSHFYTNIHIVCSIRYTVFTIYYSSLVADVIVMTDSIFGVTTGRLQHRVQRPNS